MINNDEFLKDTDTLNVTHLKHDLFNIKYREKKTTKRLQKVILNDKTKKKNNDK